MNEMAGTAVLDASTNKFNGTLVGGVWTNGPVLYDGALAFNGTSDAVYFPAPGKPAPAQIGKLNYGSIAIRFRFQSTPYGEIIPLLYYGEAHSGAPQISLIVEIGHEMNPSDQRLYFTIVNALYCYDSGTNLQPNTWYHYVAVVGPNGNTGYLDGQEMISRHYNLGSDATYTNFFSSVPVGECMALGYGRYGEEDPFYYGPCVISDVQIYNRPLSASEIQKLYLDLSDNGVLKCNCQASSDGHSLILSWPSAANCTYTILYASALAPNAWLPLAGFVNMSATPPLNSSTVPMNLPSSGFFRVQATLRSP
jgi:hypothetical protein